MDLSNVTLIGRVAADPQSKGSETIVQLSVRDAHLGTLVAIHKVVASGKLGEIIRKHVKKGSQLYVEGTLRKAAEGRTEIVADNLIMLGHRSMGTARLLPEHADG